MRVINPNPVGLIATHAALITAVHGVTGTLCGTSDTQTLTNKTIGAGGITFDNEGAGPDPILSSNAAGNWLTLTGGLIVSLDSIVKSNTAYHATISHAISAHRVFTLPDVAGTILIAEDTAQTPTFTSITVLNVGAGTDPVLSSNSAGDYLTVTGSLSLSNHISIDQDLFLRSATAFNGEFEHAISANRVWTFPDIAGTVCLWNAANAATTRYWSIAGQALVVLTSDDSNKYWTYDDANDWCQSTTIANSIIPINLPDGAIITAFRVTSQETGSGVLVFRLYRAAHSDGTEAILASTVGSATMEEVADTDIDNATVDNNTYGYYIQVRHTTNANETRLNAIQIDYTVTAPQP